MPCHNDLLPENFIDSGGVIRIIDYQLSGNNDPAFELGDIAAEADFDPDRTEALAAAYFGDELTPALAARVRLNLLLSNVTWTLWFSVHHGLLHHHTVTFDYWSEAADKWNRATGDLDAPEFGRLLDARRRPLAPPTLGRSRSDHRRTTADALDADEQRLAELGYKQELRRKWSGFSNFAISFSIISILAGCFTTFGQAWNNGGPIAISLGWPLISLFILIIGLSHVRAGLGLPDRRRHLLVGRHDGQAGARLVHRLAQPDRPDRGHRVGRLRLRHVPQPVAQALLGDETWAGTLTAGVLPVPGHPGRCTR